MSGLKDYAKRNPQFCCFLYISQSKVDERKKKGEKYGKPKIVAELNRSKKKKKEKKFLSTTHTLKK